MYAYLLFKDIAPLLSLYGKDATGEESACKTLRFFFLGVLKKFPQIKDFQVNTKYVPLVLSGQGEVAQWNSDKATLGESTVRAKTLADAKSIAIASWIKNKLQLPVHPEDNLSVLKQAQAWCPSLGKFHFFISCPKLDFNALLTIQKEYVCDRPRLGIEEFSIVGARNVVDASICVHRVQGPADFKNKKFVMHHIRQCLGKEVDGNHAFRTDISQRRLKLETERVLVAWPRESEEKDPVQKAMYRSKFQEQHPYFALAKYCALSSPMGPITSFPRITDEGLERLPDFVHQFYNAYSNQSFGTFGDIKIIQQYVATTIQQWLQCFQRFNYETCPFSCWKLGNLPELIKLCADPPLPRAFLRRKDIHKNETQEPLWTIAHACLSSVIPWDENWFHDNTSEKLICMGLFVLGNIFLWQLFPPLVTKKKKGASSTDSKPKAPRGSKREDEKSTLMMTIGFTADLAQKMSTLWMDWHDGPPPEMVAIQLRPPQDTYKKYAYYRSFNCQPITKHLLLRNLDDIVKVTQRLANGTKIPAEMLFDADLAQPASEPTTTEPTLFTFA